MKGQAVQAKPSVALILFDSANSASGGEIFKAHAGAGASARVIQEVGLFPLT